MGTKARVTRSEEQGCLVEPSSQVPAVPKAVVPIPSKVARPPRWNRTRKCDRKLTDALLLESLRGRARGIRTKAARSLMVTDRTFYKYLNERRDDLREELRAIDETIGDEVESKLMERIDEGDTTAIVFYCRTKLKHRGFVYNELPDGQQQLSPAPTGRALVQALEEVLARRQERERLNQSGPPMLELTATAAEAVASKPSSRS
jgi:hypothetical protein